MAAKINGIIRETGLRDLGQLEQDLIFRDVGSKDVIKFLKEQMDITDECKVRLLMICAATHPEKFESDKLTKLMELVNLSPEDMNGDYNMRYLEAAPETIKSSSSAFSLKKKKKKHGLRKDRPGEEEPGNYYDFIP